MQELDGRAAPPDVVRAALAAFAERRPGVRVLALDDDACDARTPRRAFSRCRRIAYAADGLRLEVQVSRSPSGLRLRLHLIPPRAVEVTVRHAGGELSASTTAAGRCALGPVCSGPVRIALRQGPGPADERWSHPQTDTEWVRL